MNEQKTTENAAGGGSLRELLFAVCVTSGVLVFSLVMFGFFAPEPVGPKHLLFFAVFPFVWVFVWTYLVIDPLTGGEAP